MTTPVLKTERLKLRPVMEEDLDTAHKEWFADPEVAKYMFWGVHRDLDETREWLDYELEMLDSDMWYRFVVCRRDPDGRSIPVGSVLLYYEEEISNWEIAYHFARKYWGQGYATEAVRRVMDFAADALCLKKVVARYASANMASGRVLRKTGFKKVEDIDYWSTEHTVKWPGVRYEYCRDTLL